MRESVYRLPAQPLPRRLCRGMLVCVRREAEIQATLDAHGTLDGLPFTEEMRDCCGGTYQVRAVLNRIYVEGDSVRALPDTVILDEVRCDGHAHGGCQRACHLLWKRAWLQAAAPEAWITGTVSSTLPPVGGPDLPCHGQAATLRQATRPLPWWQPGQYLRDLRDGTLSPLGHLRMVGRWLARQWHWYARRLLHRLRPRPTAHVVPPPPARPLQAGDLVRVRDAAVIRAMLDARGKYKGLGFSPEMAQYCGKIFRVQQVVTYLIDETNSQPHRPTGTVALEGVLCSGLNYRGCPRACPWLWRDAWLERVEE